MVLMVLTSMLMSMSILSLKLEFENVLMSMLIVNPGKKAIFHRGNINLIFGFYL